MEIKSVKRECATATVGTSVELSNRELASVREVCWDFATAINEAIKTCSSVVENANRDNETVRYNEEEITVKIPLRTAMRTHWLLDAISANETSDLFGNIDRILSETVNIKINQPNALC